MFVYYKIDCVPMYTIHIYIFPTSMMCTEKNDKKIIILKCTITKDNNNKIKI